MHLHSLANSTNETNAFNADSETTETAEHLSETKVEQQLMVDQRIIPTQTAYLDNSNALPPPVSMAEDEFSHLDVLKMPLRLGSATWGTANAINTVITTLAVPDVLGLFTTVHKQLLQVYAFMKLSLRFRVVVNTTKFHCGKLIVLYDPVSTYGTGLDRTANNVAATGYPHVIIDAGDSNSAEIDVPFENIVSFLTTNTLEVSPPMGTIIVQVFNPLQTSNAGTDPVHVSLFVSAAEIQLHMPMRPHVATFSAPPTLKMNINLKGLVGAVGDTAKTVTGAIADVKSGNFSGLFSRIKDFFSLDRPANADTRQNNCLATISPPAHMLGLDQAVRLGATQDGAYLETDFSTAPASDMSIYNIIRRPMLVFQNQWTTDDAVDATLFTFPVTPGLCANSPHDITPPQTYFNYNTFLSYFSNMFEYWRGSIDFVIDFSTTQFHSGRLMIAFEPNAATQVLPGVGETCTDFSNNPHLIFDLRENKKVTFKIPFVSSTPRKVCVPWTWAIAGAWPDSQVPDTLLLGNIYIKVLSPLVVAENLPSSIYYNIYVSAGEDFRFYAPRVRSSTRFLEDQSVVGPSLKMNIGDIVTRDIEPAPSIVKSRSLIPTPEYFGEVINDVRDLCRRYCRFNTSITMTPDANRTGVVNGVSTFGSHPDLYYAANFVSNIPIAAHSFSSLICRLYCFWTGTIRWKFVPIVDRTKNLQLVATYAFNSAGDAPQTTDNLYAYPQFIANSSQDSAIELELPFYTAFTQLLSQYDAAATAYPPSIYTPGYVQLEASSYTDAFTSNRINFTAYHAIGDDFAFRMLVAPPTTIDFIAPPPDVQYTPP